ncbi:hypothetical protein DFH07DRAFT_732124 [Mycena maculata]|uniref:Uncharacterized protein n=1 Tax=Mycena maculata TaxID=230809 RepID=A0AAD7K0X0_9AGAR|nr:hypothetical protein DFH07DRAFT_732124 [Mycena maculata]
MTVERATTYHNFLKSWVEGLTVHHPHTLNHAKRPNVHVVFHIYDFLLLFGPVISWWCFPFERIIGFLQKINTANHIGGELEGTLTKSFLRGANLRRWLRRSDCPEIIKQFKAIFDRAFAPQSERAGTSPPLVRDSNHAHYMFNGTNFSCALMHLGNSLVLYYPSTSASEPIAGSIEKIISRGDKTSFIIRCQAPLPTGQFDPFLRYYPYFPAQTYSTKMQNTTDTVHPSMILSHGARFEFSEDRAVVLNLSRS